MLDAPFTSLFSLLSLVHKLRVCLCALRINCLVLMHHLGINHIVDIEASFGIETIDSTNLLNTDAPHEYDHAMIFM